MRITAPHDLAIHVDGAEDAPDRVVYVTTLPTGRPCVLNAVAALILEQALLLGDRDAVVDALARTFEAEPEVIGQDIDAVLAGLAAQGIVSLA